jgi:hypothetical protein
MHATNKYFQCMGCMRRSKRASESCHGCILHSRCLRAHATAWTSLRHASFAAGGQRKPYDRPLARAQLASSSVRAPLAQQVRRQVNVVLLGASCRRREGSSVVVLAPGMLPVVNPPRSPPAVGYLVEEDEVRVLLRLRARLSSSRTPAPLNSLVHRGSVTLRRSTVAVVPFPSAITARACCSGRCSRQRLQTARRERTLLPDKPLSSKFAAPSTLPSPYESGTLARGYAP